LEKLSVLVNKVLINRTVVRVQKAIMMKSQGTNLDLELRLGPKGNRRENCFSRDKGPKIFFITYLFSNRFVFLSRIEQIKV